MRPKLLVASVLSVVYVCALGAWYFSTPGRGNPHDMVGPFMILFGAYGLIVIWIAVLIVSAVANTAKTLRGDGDEKQQPFDGRELAVNADEGEAWHTRQQRLREQRRQAKTNTPTDPTEE